MPQISEKRPISILAVDDHPLLREGLASAIAVAPDMKLLGEAKYVASGQVMDCAPTLVELR
jgi:DNA-binding NarL/FixJ family response regulator